MSLVRFRFWARRCSSMVEHQPSKLNTWVRFPSPALKMNILFIMREWLSWWSTTLPRSGSRVRVPSRALFLYKRVLPDSNIRGLHSVPVGANEGPLDLQRRLALFLYIKSIQEGYLFCINESCRTRTGSYLRFTPVGANKGPLDL